MDFCRDLENDKKVPAHIRLSRAKDSKSNGIPIRDFMIQAAEKYSENKGRYPDIMLFLSLHAINRKSAHIDNALNVLRISESDSVVSVQEEREPMFNYGKNGLSLINKAKISRSNF